MTLVSGREVGVPVDDSPVPVEAPQDVGDAQHHRDVLAPVNTHHAPLETDGISEVAAVPEHLVVRDESTAPRTVQGHH